MASHRFKLLLAATLLGYAAIPLAAQSDYSPDIAGWRKIPLPPGGDSERVISLFAPDYATISWRVYLAITTPEAKPTAPTGRRHDPEPFPAKADGFEGANRFKQVDDGWLVGFDHGEFGGALYWFSRDGAQHYFLTDAHVVDFFSLPDGIYAIEGLNHMEVSCGSVIRIARQTPAARWSASTVVNLPQAPDTMAVRRDGTLLIVLSDSLVSVGADHQINTLIANAPWSRLYPTSSILLPDESRLYIGMRQFVGEVDLATNQLHFLLPSASKVYATSDWRQPTDFCERMRNSTKGVSKKDN